MIVGFEVNHKFIIDASVFLNHTHIFENLLKLHQPMHLVHDKHTLLLQQICLLFERRPDAFYFFVIHVTEVFDG